MNIKKITTIIAGMIFLVGCGSNATTENTTEENSHNVTIENTTEEKNEDLISEPTFGLLNGKTGTRKNPVSLGDTVTIKDQIVGDHEITYDLTVNKIYRADAALEVLTRDLRISSNPPEGKEWAIIEITIDLIEGSNQEPYYASSMSKEIVDSTGQVITQDYEFDSWYFYELGSEDFSEVNMYPGDTHTGKIPFLVSEGDEAPLFGWTGQFEEAVYFDVGVEGFVYVDSEGTKQEKITETNEYGQEVYVGVKDGYEELVRERRKEENKSLLRENGSGAPQVITNATGELDNPVPLGETIIIEDLADGLAEPTPIRYSITVNEVLRGDAAIEKVIEGNIDRRTSELDELSESDWIVVNATVENLSEEDSASLYTRYRFDLAYTDGEVADISQHAPSVSEPFNSTDGVIFPGQSHTGNMQAYKDFYSERMYLTWATFGGTDSDESYFEASENQVIYFNME